MSDTSRKGSRETDSESSSRALRRLFAWLSLLFLFGFTGPSVPATSHPQFVPAPSVGPGAQFAIADFDGDHRLDLASVQAGKSGSWAVDYWIQLQLSSAGRQSLHIFGPPGGLVVEARDVNGDHAVDLVLSTAWFRQPVAILLNNGHGRFSCQKPAAFPAAFRQRESKRFSSDQHLGSPTSARTQSRLGAYTEKPLSGRQSETQIHPRSGSAIFLSSHYLSGRGRAPPIGR